MISAILCDNACDLNHVTSITSRQIFCTALTAEVRHVNPAALGAFTSSPRPLIGVFHLPMFDHHNFVSINSTYSNKYYISMIKQKYSTMSNPQYSFHNFEHNSEPEVVDKESMFKKVLGDQLLKTCYPALVHSRK